MYYDISIQKKIINQNHCGKNGKRYKIIHVNDFYNIVYKITHDMMSAFLT